MCGPGMKAVAGTWLPSKNQPLHFETNKRLFNHWFRGRHLEADAWGVKTYAWRELRELRELRAEGWNCFGPHSPRCRETCLTCLRPFSFLPCYVGAGPGRGRGGGES